VKSSSSDWITRVGVSPDGKRISAQDFAGKVLTWDATTGQILPGTKPAAMKERNAGSMAFSPDDALRATLDGGKLWVIRLPEPVTARKRQRELEEAFAKGLTHPDPAYHRRMADLYEKSGEEFAATFHLRQLLRIEPTEAVRKRLAAIEAVSKSEVAIPKTQPARMPYAR
jgi:hypothetical protein